MLYKYEDLSLYPQIPCESWESIATVYKGAEGSLEQAG